MILKFIKNWIKESSTTSQMVYTESTNLSPGVNMFELRVLYVLTMIKYRDKKEDDNTIIIVCVM